MPLITCISCFLSLLFSLQICDFSVLFIKMMQPSESLGDSQLTERLLEELNNLKSRRKLLSKQTRGERGKIKHLQNKLWELREELRRVDEVISIKMTELSVSEWDDRLLDHNMDVYLWYKAKVVGIYSFDFL